MIYLHISTNRIKNDNKLTKLKWEEILLNDKITNEFDISMFQALYSFEKHKAPASQIGKLLGYNGKKTLGLLLKLTN